MLYLKITKQFNVNDQVELQEDPGPVSQSISVRNNTLYMFGGVVLDEPSNNLYTLDLSNLLTLLEYCSPH